MDAFRDNPPKAAWDTMARHRRQAPDPYPMELELEYAGPRQHAKARKGPNVVLAEPFVYTSPKSGRVTPVQRVSLFTNTSKMTCPSFSIPAGPFDRGGTCQASRQATTERLQGHPVVAQQFAEAPEYTHRTKRRTAMEPPLYVCDICYAGKGRYVSSPLNAIRQTFKLAWARATLQAGIFVEQMRRAIAAMRDLPIASQEAEGINTRFFRIHDSGDFFSPEYYAAWVAVCVALPDIQFWAPTRQWVFPRWRDLFTEFPPPPNLTLRPSALFIGAPAPHVPGLAAGSTASAEALPKPIWNCPAYAGDDASTHNCESKRCRACWDRPQVPVSYREH